MNDGSSGLRQQRGRRLAVTLAAVVLAVGGIAVIATSVITDRPAPPRSAGFGSASPTPIESATAASTSPARTKTPHRTAPPTPTRGSSAASSSPSISRSADPDDSAPISINVPKINIDADFVPLDLAANGELDTPQIPDQVGWFTGARTPGGPGVAVIAGHVTWNGAEAAFFRLGDLQRGDRVKIDRADGGTAIFAVQRMATFAKDDFPTEQVYRRSTQSELVMITCGGEFDADRHYYDSNVIVWADLVSMT